MKRITPALVFFLFGCAHSYSLKPVTEKPEFLNGIALNTLETKRCVLQAGYQDFTNDAMLIRVKVLNKSDASFDLDASYFSLTGNSETLDGSPLPTIDPERYLKDLESTAEMHESRAKMETYQGIDALGTLEGSDKEIERAKSQYRQKQKEAVDAEQDAAAARRKIAMIKPIALRKTTIKSGETAEGVILIRSAFKGEGAVALVSSHPACSGELGFLLKR